MPGDQLTIVSIARRMLCVLCVFCLSVGCKDKTKPATPSTKKATKKADNKTTQKLVPPTEPEPTIAKGQLPFDWPSKTQINLSPDQIVLYVTHANYVSQFGKKTVQLKYRPGQVEKVDETFAYIKPYGAQDAKSEPIVLALVIAMETTPASAGDIVLSWSPTKYPYIQRAYVDKGGESPAVTFLDLAVNHQSKQKGTLKKGTFHRIDPKQKGIGASVVWKHDDILMHGTIVALSTTHVLVRSFGGQGYSRKLEDIQLVTSPSSLLQKQRVMVPFLGGYMPGTIKYVGVGIYGVDVEVGQKVVRMTVPAMDIMAIKP